MCVCVGDDTKCWTQSANLERERESERERERESEREGESVDLVVACLCVAGEFLGFILRLRRSSVIT